MMLAEEMNYGAYLLVVLAQKRKQGDLFRQLASDTITSCWQSDSISCVFYSRVQSNICHTSDVAFLRHLQSPLTWLYVNTDSSLASFIIIDTIASGSRFEPQSARYCSSRQKTTSHSSRSALINQLRNYKSIEHLLESATDYLCQIP